MFLGEIAPMINIVKNNKTDIQDWSALSSRIFKVVDRWNSDMYNIIIFAIIILDFWSSTYLGVSKVVDASTKSEKHEHEDFSDFPKVKPKTYGMKKSNSTELLCDPVSEIENRSDAPRPSPRPQI